MTPKSLSCLREDEVQPCPVLTPPHSQPGIQSITMAGLGWHFIHSTDDLMPRLHRGISDYLTATLDGNQEAPPRDTNAGSNRRITSYSFFPPFSTFSISHCLPLTTQPAAFTSSVFLFLLHTVRFPSLLSALVISVSIDDVYSSSWCLFSHQCMRKMLILL